MSSTIGLDPNRVSANPEFGINQFGDVEDKSFVYVQFNSAVGEKGEVCVIANDGLAHPLTTSTDLVGRRVGIAPDVVPINSYCWLLVRGGAQFLVAANCAAHTALRATAVGGVVDDTGSGPVIEGIVSTVAGGSMQGLVDGRLLHPTLQEQGAGGTGTTVVANPGGTGLTDLDTITIGSTDYDIPAGGGGGLDIPSLTALDGSVLAAGDGLVVYDLANTENKKITPAELFQGLMLRNTVKMNPASVGGSDQFALLDHSASEIRHLEWTDLQGLILSDAVPIVEGSAIPGVATEAARADHVHPSGGGGGSVTLSDTIPIEPTGIVGIAGTSGEVSRQDHVHPDRYTDVATWTRTGDFVDGDLYQTGITLDTSYTWFHFCLNVSGSTSPRQLEYKRMLISEWTALTVDVHADGADFPENDRKSGIFVFATDDRFNVISCHLRRYDDAGDNKLSIGIMTNPSDPPSEDINGIRYFYEV